MCVIYVGRKIFLAGLLVYSLVENYFLIQPLQIRSVSNLEPPSHIHVEFSVNKIPKLYRSRQPSIIKIESSNYQDVLASNVF